MDFQRLLLCKHEFFLKLYFESGELAPFRFEELRPLVSKIESLLTETPKPYVHVDVNFQKISVTELLELVEL